MNTLNDFITKWNGKFCEMECTWALNQCMDLAFAWCDNLEIPRETIRHEYAYQVFENPFPITTQYFNLINNTPENVPQPGDLVIWHLGELYHISIFVNGDVKSFNSFDQNWPYNSKCHIQAHRYEEGVIGWLRPRQISTMMIEKKVFEDLISKLDKQEKDIEQKNSSIAILENQIKLAQQDVEVLKKEKKKLTDEIISLSAFPELVKNIVFGKGWWWTKLVRVKALFNVNI